MQNLQNELIDLLKHEDNLVIDGHLNKNKIVELALKVEPQLISLLIKNDTFKKHFFQEVENVLVFDKIKFQRFVNNKSFLPDSYTAFKNKIGLITNDDDLDNFISTSNEVVLAWPHKDCVLEGGQTKEDQKRNEIFWNETLAPDSVDRLLDAKALTNFKMFDKDGEHKVTEIKGNENLVIKGNNLLTLASLLKTHRGKIKLIYIDPPYNTGNDSFNYNDSFNHSSWLTFMKNRLAVARKLLNDDGVIFVQCDDYEQAYLKVLMDEVFGRENFVSCIVYRKTDNQANIGNIARVKEYILLFSKNKNVKLNKIPLSEKAIKEYRYQDEIGKFRRGILLDKTRGTNIYDITTPSGTVLSGPWMVNESKFQELRENGGIYWTSGGDEQPYSKIYLENSKGQIPSDWIDKEYGTNQQAAIALEKLLGYRAFDFSKSVPLIKHFINIGSGKDDIILDYHAGSGTTAQAVLELNKEDDGNRKFIICEQMDYINTVTNKRIEKVIQLNQQGTFVYAELLEYNQKYFELIQLAETKEKLINVWHEMQDTAFLSYQFDKKSFNERLDAFKTASIDDMKQYLIEVLDKNQLYVNYSEINDETFKVSQEDKELNKQFYSKK
jgi:adenine-specific DNA-methyltransferase